MLEHPWAWTSVSSSKGGRGMSLEDCKKELDELKNNKN